MRASLLTAAAGLLPLLASFSAVSEVIVDNNNNNTKNNTVTSRRREIRVWNSSTSTKYFSICINCNILLTTFRVFEKDIEKVFSICVPTNLDFALSLYVSRTSTVRTQYVNHFWVLFSPRSAVTVVLRVFPSKIKIGNG